MRRPEANSQRCAVPRALCAVQMGALSNDIIRGTSLGIPRAVFQSPADGRHRHGAIAAEAKHAAAHFFNKGAFFVLGQAREDIGEQA
jgi:hypothetical protein